jgi:hypothetical protein
MTPVARGLAALSESVVAFLQCLGLGLLVLVESIALLAEARRWRERPGDVKAKGGGRCP